MSRVCELCGKGQDVGNLVSHSKRRTKTRRYPNLQTKVVDVDGVKKRLRICTNCLKTIVKKRASVR